MKPKPWEYNRRVNPHIEESENILNPETRGDAGPPVKDKKVSKLMVDLWKLIIKWSMKNERTTD